MDPLQNLLNEYTKGLAPMKAFTKEVMPYEKFAAPMQQFTKAATEQYKPWYEYFQAAPQKEQLRASAATNNLGMSGFGQNTMQRNLRQLYQPLENALQGMQEQYTNQWINPLYNQRIQQYYQSPITGFNYNAIK